MTKFKTFRHLWLPGSFGGHHSFYIFPQLDEPHKTGMTVTQVSAEISAVQAAKMDRGQIRNSILQNYYKV